MSPTCAVPRVSAFTLLIVPALLWTVPAHAQTDGTFDCIIEARQMVEIRSPVEGLIEKIHVERGDTVERGQVVVTLESGPERAALAVAKSRAEQAGAVKAAEARLSLAQRKETRAEELSRQNFVSSNALEEARTERMLAESELKVARESQRLAELEVKRSNEAVSLRTIRTPISGVVVERNMKTGELASTNVKEPIMRLAEIDPLNVEVIIPASLYGTVKIGDHADVMPETPKGTFDAKVVVVDKVINAASGTFGVRLELPNAKKELPAGARCKVRFSVPAQAAAPATARPNR
ncbi:MAG: efflux RND transporter periplasmic adaptor subunit [Burkholderiales bacterium]